MEYMVTITDPHYTAGMAGGVAVPVPDGSAFELWSTDGELLAEAAKADGGGYITDGEYIFGTWADALADASGGILTADEIATLETN